MPHLTTRKTQSYNSPGLVASYDLQPGNGVGLFWYTTHTPDPQRGKGGLGRIWTKVDNAEGRFQHMQTYANFRNWRDYIDKLFNCFQSEVDWLQLTSVQYYVFLCKQVQNSKHKSHTKFTPAML